MIYRDRKTIRLKGYDYAQPGYYFVTLCTQNKAHLFGRIATVGAAVNLNDAGNMIDIMYRKSLDEFPNTVLHEYIVMPNHLHGIIQILQNDSDNKTTLPHIIQSFKRKTTLKYIDGVKNGIYEPFETRVWKRGYYDRIIRNDEELMNIQQYIINNPLKWSDDEYYD